MVNLYKKRIYLDLVAMVIFICLGTLYTFNKVGAPDNIKKYHSLSCYDKGDMSLEFYERTALWFVIACACMNTKNEWYLTLFYVPQIVLPFFLYAYGYTPTTDLFLNVKFFCVWCSMVVHYLLRVHNNFPLHQYGCMILWVPNVVVLLSFEIWHVYGNHYALWNMTGNFFNTCCYCLHITNRNFKMGDIFEIDTKGNISELEHHKRFFMASWFVGYWLVVLAFMANHTNIGYSQIECFLGCFIAVFYFGVDKFAQFRVANLYPWCIWAVFFLDLDEFAENECMYNNQRTMVIDDFNMHPEFTKFNNNLNVASFSVNAVLLFVNLAVYHYFHKHTLLKEFQKDHEMPNDQKTIKTN